MLGISTGAYPHILGPQVWLGPELSKEGTVGDSTDKTLNCF